MKLIIIMISLLICIAYADFTDLPEKVGKKLERYNYQINAAETLFRCFLILSLTGTSVAATRWFWRK